MAKALRTAAIVVGAVALVATGIGAAAGAGILGATTLAAGASAATVATLATVATVASIASVAAGVLSLAAGLTAKKPTAEATGSQTSFSADPDAGIPAVLGRTGTAGNIVARFGYDTKDAGDNDRQTFISVLSLGPVAEIDPRLGVDRVPVSFNAAGQAIGGFAGYMWRQVQVGLLTSAALTFGTGAGTPPGWTAEHRLSGKAATTWTLRFDTKSKLYQNNVPAPMNVVRGRLVYDPRKDSTYPGGNGPHRMADPANRAAYDAAFATWEYSENPYLHALAFVHGYWQRDLSNQTSDWQRVMGMGAPAAGIDVAAFVEGANIADANRWTVGGVIYSGDDKWGSLKKILQAGMGEPLALGARISCLINAPRVSLATIGIDDVIGEASVGATQPRRERVNTITPRFRLEENDWQLLPGAPLSVAEHVATDKGRRSKTQDYPLIQSTSQIGTAVRYDIENAREFGPIVLPCKLVWMGYKPGDCVSVRLPELGLNGQPVLLLNRTLAPSGGTVTLTARSETPGKHAYALGQTATPPPTPGVTGPYLVPVPGANAWNITGTELTANGATVPALIVTGAVDTGTAEAIVFEYRPFVNGQSSEMAWRGASPQPVGTIRKDINSVAPGTAYEVAVSYQARGVIGARRIIGPVTTAGTALSFDNVNGPNKPADNATNSGDPKSPFGPGGTVGGTIDRLSDFDKAIIAANKRTATLENETIPAVDRAVKNAGDRITAARAQADKALSDLGSEAKRLDTRIDAAVAAGGYDDTDIRAKVGQASTAAADAKRSVADLTTDVAASFRGVNNTFANYDQRITTLSTGFESFGTRATALEASSRADTTKMNGNANFSNWPDDRSIPSGWGLAQADGACVITRVPGILGRWATQASYPGGPGGFFLAVSGLNFGDPYGGIDPGMFGGPGWYVMEADLTLDSGSLVGAGLYCGAYNSNGVAIATPSGHFPDQPANGSAAPGAGLPGARYRFAMLLDFTDPNTRSFRFHPMTSWQGFVGNTPAKKLTWHMAGLRAATPSEIAARRADTTATEALAKARAAEVTLADLPNRYASAQRTADLEAQVNFAADSGLQRTINARFEDRATVIADAKAGAVAQTVSTLRGEYNGTKTEVSDQRGVLNGLNGKTAAYVRILADAGNGRAALSLWSDQYGGAWSLTGDGLIDGNLTINGTLKAKAFDRSSMSRYASSVWTGALTPSAGSRVMVPWSLGLSTIAPVGRFIYEFVAVVSTNAGQRTTTTRNGKPYYIDYVPDTGGLEVICLDPQGNGYRPRANGSDPVLATADFAPLFQASIGNGSYDTGIIDDGDYYMRQIAATYTVTRIELRLTWVAV